MSEERKILGGSDTYTPSTYICTLLLSFCLCVFVCVCVAAIQVLESLSIRTVTPSPELVAGVKDVFQRTDDARFLLPVFTGLTKVYSLCHSTSPLSLCLCVCVSSASVFSFCLLSLCGCVCVYLAYLS